MIIPIFPKRTGLLYGIMGLPVAAAMVWYVALVNMGSWYKVMFVAWLFCIPFSIAHTFLNMPKTKIDLKNPRLGWETRNDDIFKKNKVVKFKDEYQPSPSITRKSSGVNNPNFDNTPENVSNRLELEKENNFLVKRSSILSVATEYGHNIENVLNLEDHETQGDISKFKLYIREVTSLPVICTLLWYRVVLSKCQIQGQKHRQKSHFRLMLAFFVTFLQNHLYFTAKTRQMATTAQYESWLRFKTTDNDEVKLYTEYYDLFLIAGTFLEPAVGFSLDWITLNVIQRRFDYEDNEAKSLTSGVFMTIASILACLCSVFQFPEGVGISTVFYLICHVLLISFLYSSRYVALVVNTSPECQGQVIATSTALQLTVPIWITLSTQFLDKVLNGNYNDLSFIFLGLTGIGLVFPVAIVVYRMRQNK